MSKKTKTYAELLREDRRLVLLRLLSESPGRRSNSSILHAGVRFLQIMSDRHDVLDDLRFLQLQGLVELEQMGDIDAELFAVRLRSLGQMVVDGEIDVAGIKPALLK